MPERIRLQVADGTWETLGVDRNPGVFPEGITPSWDAGGPAGLTFNLKRRPDVVLVDLEEFTPVEYQPDGERVTWSGFIVDTPGNEDGVTVNAQGWGSYPDETPLKVLYVLDDLAPFTDLRQLPEARLDSTGMAAAVVNNEGKRLIVGWPRGTVLGPGGATATGELRAPYAAAYIDLGPDPAGWAVSAAVEYRKSSSILGVWHFLVRGVDDPGDLTRDQLFGDLDRGGGEANDTDYIASVDFGGARRYVAVGVWFIGAQVTLNEDDLWTVTALRLFGKTAYRSGVTSILKASDVVKDAFGRLPLLSTDQSQVAATTMPLRSFRADDESARTIAARANDYHQWRLKVDAERRVVFQPQSDRAVLAVNLSDPGVSWRDATVNSGRDVYNRVLARGRTGSGQELRLVRNAYSAADVIGVPQVANPSADVDAAGWAAYQSRGILVRDTAVYWSSPASLRLDSNANGDAFDHAAQLTGTFDAGVRYRLRCRARLNDHLYNYLNVKLDTAQVGGTRIVDVALYGRVPGVARLVWYLLEVDFIPATTLVNPWLHLQGSRLDAPLEPSGTAYGWLDDIFVTRPRATSADRRGRQRTYIMDVTEPTALEGMAALADAFLGLHGHTPLAGEVEVSGDDVVTTSPGGAPVGLGDLGTYTGELILLRNLIDPDTGDVGRVGIIRAVSRSGDRATITLDNERTNFQGLLARMGAL